MKNPRYANSAGGILLEQDDGICLYVDSGELYDKAQRGAFGQVAPFPGVPLEHLQAERRRSIDAARDAACIADVMVNGKYWQADQRSQQMLASAISLGGAGLPLPTAWRARDNTDMTVTGLADLLAIAGAIAAQTQSAYEKSWELKAQIDAATTAEEVEAVQW